MRKNEIKKLRLSRETLRELRVSEFRGVVVGHSVISWCLITREGSGEDTCDACETRDGCGSA